MLTGNILPAFFLTNVLARRILLAGPLGHYQTCADTSASARRSEGSGESLVLCTLHCVGAITNDDSAASALDPPRSVLGLRHSSR